MSACEWDRCTLDGAEQMNCERYSILKATMYNNTRKKKQFEFFSHITSSKVKQADHCHLTVIAKSKLMNCKYC